MSVRAKFVVNEKKVEGDNASINMLPVYSGSEENKDFFRYTPAGAISLSIVNLKAADQFIVGKSYYVDFTEAPE